MISNHERSLYFLALAFWLIAAGSASAQRTPFEVWHEGRIVLSTGDTLSGFVKYDLQQDIVQFADKKKNTGLFTAQKVVFFEIFDSELTRYRRFFTLPYSTPTGYRTPVFFELLHEGKLTALAREYLEYRRFSSPYMMGSYSQPVVAYKFFFLNEKGIIEEFTGNKNDFFRRTGSRSREVEEYVRKNRLRLDNRADFSRAVEYYNSFFER